MSMINVLVTAPFPTPLIEKLRAVSPQLKIEQWLVPADKQWPADKTMTAEVYYAVNAVPTPEQAPHLQWIQAHWAGVDHMRQEAIWNSNIPIATASGVHAPNMGQYVFAQILAWAHRVPRWLYYQQKKEWPKDRWQKFVPDELHGRTLGILGYGSVGREVARLAKGFGMTVLATKRDARSLEHSGYTPPGSGDPEGKMADRIYPTEATRSMVAECDYVVITLPLTDKTYHLFDEPMFRAMKPNSFLINVGRGPVVKEADLARALRRGWLAGAGLDVFEVEPLPSDSPLLAQENVIISPHVSGFTPNYDERVTDLFAENLRRYLAGEPLLNVVDREAGY
jgi:phosphoglycerate dehydrogenase-like enzyme